MSKTDVIDAAKENLGRIKDKLPPQYGKLISAKLDGKFSPEQVRLVFYNQIKNPLVVIPVLEKAHELIRDMGQVKDLQNIS